MPKIHYMRWCELAQYCVRACAIVGHKKMNNNFTYFKSKVTCKNCIKTKAYKEAEE